MTVTIHTALCIKVVSADECTSVVSWLRKLLTSEVGVLLEHIVIVSVIISVIVTEHIGTIRQYDRFHLLLRNEDVVLSTISRLSSIVTIRRYIIPYHHGSVTTIAYRSDEVILRVNVVLLVILQHDGVVCHH